MDLQVLLQEVQQLYETEKGGGADLSEDNFVEEISAALAELDDEVNGPQETMDLSPSRRSRVDLSTLDGVMAMASSGSGRSRHAVKIGSVFEEYLTSVPHFQKSYSPTRLTWSRSIAKDWCHSIFCLCTTCGASARRRPSMSKRYGLCSNALGSFNELLKVIGS